MGFTSNQTRAVPSEPALSLYSASPQYHTGRSVDAQPNAFDLSRGGGGGDDGDGDGDGGDLSDADSLPDNAVEANDAAAGGGGGGENKRPKRARACIACRNMKIRCLPVAGKETCLACSKVNRECVMPGPARKRQKTVHKVAELEKKINALTEALIAKNAMAAAQLTKLTPTSTTESPSPVNDNSNTISNQHNEPPSDVNAMSDINNSNSNNDDNPRSSSSRMTSNNHRKRNSESPHPPAELWRPPPAKTATGPSWDRLSRRPDLVDSSFGNVMPTYVDPIERGRLDMDTAALIFQHYVKNMLPLCPFLALPSDIKAEDVRSTRPTLFLAILCVGSPAIRPELQPDLVVECTKWLSHRTLFLGEKSLELVQALLTYCAYYVRSRHAKDLLFNQFIHTAVVMSLDLGFGKRLPSKGLSKRPEDNDNESNNKVDEADGRRTWLACYYTNSSVSTILRQPSLIRWSRYIEECLDFFSTLSSSSSTESDAWLCALVRAQHISEEASSMFNTDDPSTTEVSFNDPRTGYCIRILEKKLADWKASAPAHMDRRLIEHVAAAQNLYMHETAIQNAHTIGDNPSAVAAAGFSSPFVAMAVGSAGTGTAKPVSMVTAAHIDALTACVDSCHRILNSYLSLDVATARRLANLYVVWNTCAAVALIKLDGVVHGVQSPFRSIFTPDLRVDHYLSSLFDKLLEVSGSGNNSKHSSWPPAEAFSIVAKKLISWHQHKRGVGMDHDKSGSTASAASVAAAAATSTSATVSGNINANSISACNSIVDLTAEQARREQGQLQLESQQQQQQQGFGLGSYNNGSSDYQQAQPQQQVVPSFTQQQQQQQQSIHADLNMAFNVASYNINWDELTFSQDELNLFDSYMNDQGWMGYLL